MKRVLVGMMILCIALCGWVSPSFAEPTENGDVVTDDAHQIACTFEYDKAFQVLQLVNQKRAAEGLPELKMDASLMDSAMQRAVEIGVYSTYIRPNGEMNVDINPFAEEEIQCYLEDTAKEAMNEWMDFDDEKEAILNPDYTTVGVGCICQGETRLWVQLFGKNEISESAEQPANMDTIVNVEIGDPCDVDVPLKINPEEVKGLPGATRQLSLKTKWDLVFVGSSVIWRSSDENVATVDENGVVTFHNNGECTITANSAHYERASVTAECVSKMDIVFLDEIKCQSAVYTGKRLKPEVTVRDGNTILTKGVDYTVSYSQNVNVGFGTATVKGIGKYCGEDEFAFRILPRPVKIVSAKAGKKSATVKWKKVSAKGRKQIGGFQVMYSQNKDFQNAKIKTVKGNKKTSVTIKKLAKGKRYYFKVRTYKMCWEDRLVSKWSAVKSTKIK